MGLHSSKVLRWAAGLAAEFESKLTLLHVVPRLDSPGEDYYAHEWRRLQQTNATEAISEVQSEAGTNADILLETGEVSRAVAAALARLGADLVIVGRGACDNARLRTHAHSIIRDSPCPVVSV